MELELFFRGLAVLLVVLGGRAKDTGLDAGKNIKKYNIIFTSVNFLII